MTKQLITYKHWHEKTKQKKTENVAGAGWDPNKYILKIFDYYKICLFIVRL